jgi:TonB-linked SusC/RagA family outer membrane protein
MKKALKRLQMKRFLIIMFTLTGFSQVGAQNLKITGSVSSNDGVPLSNVSVTVKNSLQGTTTDKSGHFQIAAGINDSLMFSRVGYQSVFVRVANSEPLDIKLNEASSSLNEVVIIGYGSQKRAKVTGAVSQIDSKMLEDRPIGDAGQALQGIIPNLNVSFDDGHPGSAANFNIRGYTSINGGQPLVIIDGAPGDINMLNVSDIASVSVLKDASSAAIYGARAAYGVILITTKEGKKGKLQVQYSGNFSVGTPTTSHDFMTDGYNTAKLIDDAYKISKGSSFTGYTEDDYAELKKRQTDHSLPSAAIVNRNGKDQYFWYGNTDWWNYFFRNDLPSTSHTLRISGGSEKLTFMVSGRYYQQNGIMKLNQDKFVSYNFRSKIDAHVNSWLTISDNLQFANTTYNYPGWTPNEAFHDLGVSTLPSYLPVNPDGTFTYRSGLNNQAIANGYSADLLNGKSKGQEKQFDITNTLNFDFNVSKAIQLTASYSYNLHPASSFQRRTPSPWSIYPGVISYVGTDVYSEQSDLDQYHVLNLYGTISRHLGKNSFKLLAGYNSELKKYHTISGSANNLLSTDLNELDLGTSGQKVGSNSVEWALQGYFARLNYDYDGKYLLELNGRYDGSSHFPEEKRYGFFPSVSAGWRISEESFFEPLKDAISEFKIRGSFGSLGNQSLSTNLRNQNYPYIPVMNNGLTEWLMSGGQAQYLSIGSPVSPDLTWEKTTSLNGGIDLGLFENKLNVSFDTYDRKTIGMLIPGKTLPQVFGASSPKQNAGDLDTKGWEFSAQWENRGVFKRKPLVLHFGVVISDFKSHITRFDNPTNLLNNYYEGERLGQIWGYNIGGYFLSDDDAEKYDVNQDYVNQGRLASPGDGHRLQAGDLKYIDLDGNKVINVGQNTLADHGDLKVIGNSLPRYSFGINAGGEWNGFSISAFFQGVGHQDWYPGNFANLFWGPFTFPYGSFIPKDFESKLWSPENPDSYFPKLRGYAAQGARWELNSPNDRYIQNLAYVRLKNLTVGYSLPSSILKNLRFQKVRFYVSGENLFTITALDTKYIDPEQVSLNPDGYGSDKNAWNYPFMKKYSVGLDITF